MIESPIVCVVGGRVVSGRDFIFGNGVDTGRADRAVGRIPLFHCVKRGMER